ncbi:MAG: hypothetical protein H7X83_10570 [Verrucomicrobia bacterium]|nr:hypothetical protein [Deltaproteobacteria bacterium]
MKNILIAAALLLLIAGTALAGTGYDECIKEEKALKAQEAGKCSGLKYLLNPSGCFATRKVLKGYATGKCREIGMSENVDFSVPKVIPEKKSINVGTSNQQKVESGAAQQESTMEQLKEENARLKAEIIRLKAENEQLRKAGR